MKKIIIAILGLGIFVSSSINARDVHGGNHAGSSSSHTSIDRSHQGGREWNNDGRENWHGAGWHGRGYYGPYYGTGIAITGPEVFVDNLDNDDDVDSDDYDDNEIYIE